MEDITWITGVTSSCWHSLLRIQCVQSSSRFSGRNSLTKNSEPTYRDKDSSSSQTAAPNGTEKQLDQIIQCANQCKNKDQSQFTMEMLSRRHHYLLHLEGRALCHCKVFKIYNLMMTWIHKVLTYWNRKSRWDIRRRAVQLICYLLVSCMWYYVEGRSHVV